MAVSTNEVQELDDVFAAEIELRVAEDSLRRARKDAELAIVGLLHPLAQEEKAQALRVAVATERVSKAREQNARGRRSRARGARWRAFLHLPPHPLLGRAIPLPLIAPMALIVPKELEGALTARERRVLERETRDA